MDSQAVYRFTHSGVAFVTPETHPLAVCRSLRHTESHLKVVGWMVLSSGSKRDDLVALRRMKPLVSHLFG